MLPLRREVVIYESPTGLNKAHPVSYGESYRLPRN